MHKFLLIKLLFNMKELNAKLISRASAAKLLGVETNTLAVWATNKRYNLPYYKIGSKVRYKISDLEKFIQNGMVGGEDE